MEIRSGMAAVDSEARFTSMFERHYNEVLAYCARRSTRADADDAAAEVFATAWRRIDDIEWETVRPWLYGIARGVMTNRWRSLKRQGQLTKKMASMAPQSFDDPDVVVVRRSQDAEVLTVLRLLKPSDQEVLMLSAWEELTAPEIAVVLEISTSAVEQRLHRAKKRLAKRLEQKQDPGALPSVGAGEGEVQ
ncbi:MAG: RNA polymerase sigma factor [Acidimicrobiia bacterium]